MAMAMREVCEDEVRTVPVVCYCVCAYYFGYSSNPKTDANPTPSRRPSLILFFKAGGQPDGYIHFDEVFVLLCYHAIIV